MKPQKPLMKLADRLRLPKILKREDYRKYKKVYQEMHQEVYQDIRDMQNLLLKSVDCGEPSRSQLGQDVLVLLLTNFKRKGYFVEIGAANGIDLSNTYLLEKAFCWSGICAEPAKIWHDSLKRARSAVIEHECVWARSGEKLEFNMTDLPELSTLDSYTASDHHAENRISNEKYLVNSVSLDDLLARHGAPSDIDYISIDTEGSEYDILRTFDFSKWNVKVITCEHNYTGNREKIYNLLTDNNFSRVYTRLSRWDDWYVQRSDGIQTV